MRLLAPDREAVVYAISCELGLTKIGVTADAQERRRAMQVGSPVALELAGCYRFPTAQAAYAVAADVQRQLGDRRRGRGGPPATRPGPAAPLLAGGRRGAALGARTALDSFGRGDSNPFVVSQVNS